MTALKIALIAPQFPPQRGGMEVYAYEVAKELTSRGHEVTVFSLVSPDAKDDYPFRVRRLLTGKFVHDRKFLPELEEFEVVHIMNVAWSWIARGRRHVFASIYGNDFLNPNPVYGYDLKERLHFKKGDRIDYLLARQRTARMMRRIVPAYKKIFAISQHTADRFCEKFEGCKPLISLNYLGVSAEYLDSEMHRELTSNPAPQILTVCRSER
jgi:glycosyltransferase involved in cell wall biosynthesis